jgi:hypothetical protein
MSFCEMADELRAAISEQGYSGAVRTNRIAGLNRVVSFCAELEKDMSVKEALVKYYAHLKSRLIDDMITAYQFQNEVKMINFVQRYCRLDNVTRNKQYEPLTSRYRQPTEYYRQLLSDY